MIALRVFVSTWSVICLYRALARSLRFLEAVQATKVTRFPTFTVGRHVLGDLERCVVWHGDGVAEHGLVVFGVPKCPACLSG